MAVECKERYMLQDKFEDFSSLSKYPTVAKWRSTIITSNVIASTTADEERTNNIGMI